MIKPARTIRLCAGIIILSMSGLFSNSALAAGSVEMQVEHIINQAMEEYNQSMEAGDPESWLKYFSDNVTRQSPISSESGKKEFSAYFASEFKNFKAKYVVKKMIFGGRSAAVIFTWDAVHKKSNANIKVDMIGIYEMDTSGRFGSVIYYYDTAKIGKVLEDMAGKNK
jgi:predicted SnoaL-like aldol condensation-catalyzing enzyme